MNLLKNKKKFSGGALILQMFLAVCFMVWLFPVNAFAATSVSWKNDVKRLFSTSGGSVAGKYKLDMTNKELIIYNGYCMNIEYDETFNYEDITVYGTVDNYGTINGGIFNGAVKNNNVIENGTFNGTVTNEFGCNINNGKFTNAVINYGSINDGTFTNTSAVTNNGTIEKGIFNGAVTNNAHANINGGTFEGNVTNEGFISSSTNGTVKGKFNGTVTNYGSISYGSFHIIMKKDNSFVGDPPYVTYDELINEGNGSNPNPNPGDDESNTSNSKDNADNDNEYVFVEPVVIVVPEGQKYVDDVMEQLATVPTDGKVVIDTKDWYCFNRTLAEKVTSMKDVTVTIKYKYQGKRYEVTIPAGSDVVSLLGETGFVGFRYLDLVFGGREITE